MRLIVLSTLCFGFGQGLLYPKETLTRDVRRLDGFWKFKLAPINDPQKGFTDKWHKDDWDKIELPYETSAVPSSYNDLSQNETVRDHVGYVWYQRNFFVPYNWLYKRIVLNFGSVHYRTIVYVNGKLAMEHVMGHLPFEAEVQSLLNFDRENTVTVAINNTLTEDTLPPGSLTLKIGQKDFPPFFYKNQGNFDFFNYAGIHRGVFLYATEETHISDVVVRTVLAKTKTSRIFYNVEAAGKNAKDVVCSVSIQDKQQKVLLTESNCSSTVVLKNVTLWWPYTHSSEPGYQYTLVVSLSIDNRLVDQYPVKFGIRRVTVNAGHFFVNSKRFYFTGFGKHEDAAVRGKGLDLPLIVKDMNLIKWLGANSIRTSHYPYSEELMDMCDDLGIVVIDECPAVGLKHFSGNLLKLHEQSIRELIARDKNRPSVFMWSVANEPRSDIWSSHSYFRKVIALTRSLDNTRPITAALNIHPKFDRVGTLLDVIMFNNYASWYSNPSFVEVIEYEVLAVARTWIQRFKKPIFISEYGADTVSGLHTSPSQMFSEDYQSEVLIKHHRAFDTLRSEGYFVGEHIWNFADFMTAQGITRVVGNRKGILTRDRQPKASGKIMRCRYHTVGNLSMTDDGFYCPHPTYSVESKHNEL